MNSEAKSYKLIINVVALLSHTIELLQGRNVTPSKMSIYTYFQPKKPLI